MGQIEKAATPAAEMPIDRVFAGRVNLTAKRQLETMLGTAEGAKASQRIVMAMVASMQAARDPRAFLEVTDSSVAECVSLSHETGLLPGGPNSPVYLVPQAARSGEQPALQWRINHRGLARIALEAGYRLNPVPVGLHDEIEIAFGEVAVHRAAPDYWPKSLEDLLGVCLVCERIDDRAVLCRAWMPISAILERRAVARDQSVWKAWPIEQAQKTAVKWAFARGIIAFSSRKMDLAIEADNAADGFPSAAPKRVENTAAPAVPAEGRHAVYTDAPSTPVGPGAGRTADDPSEPATPEAASEEPTAAPWDVVDQRRSEVMSIVRDRLGGDERDEDSIPGRVDAFLAKLGHAAHDLADDDVWKVVREKANRRKVWPTAAEVSS
jgi:hypothetical protein